MATLTLRNVKGSPLTSVEMDSNLSDLNDELVTSASLGVDKTTVTLTTRGTSVSDVTVDLSGLNADQVDGKEYTDILSDATALAIALG